MQADHDGPGAPARRKRRLSGSAGLALVSVGLLILAAVGSYYGYRVYAHSQLDRLDASLDGPVSLPAEAAKAGFLPVAPHEPGQAADSNGAQPESVAADKATTPDSETVAAAAQASLEDAPSLVSLYTGIYPGHQMHPRYWGQPMWAGTDPYPLHDGGLPEGYRLVSDYDVSSLPGTTASAQRIQIPIIGVDSNVSELRILDLGNSRAYETPDNVIGHIPETSNPGEKGNGWFFGHLESPFKGEGSVFRRLPQIPEHLRNGDAVFVSVESQDGKYLYQVVSTRVVHQDDLHLYGSEDANITLVSCVPRLVYDHRLLVTAKLVGVKS